MQCIANIDNDSDVSRLNRGQLCSYAAAHVGLSFASTPSPYLCGLSARFIRWDRRGATVTRSFDYIKEPHILASFFWCYAHLNHGQRGYDTSFSPASPGDLRQIQHVEKRLLYNPEYPCSSSYLSGSCFPYQFTLMVLGPGHVTYGLETRRPL